MAGMLWISDREPAVRELFAEVVPEAEVLTPDELEARLSLGQRPDGLIVDGTQLLDMPANRRASLLELPRLLICTGVLLASMPMNLISGPGVAVLAKPFCVEDLESAAEWLRGASDRTPPQIPFASLVQRRRPRRPRTRLPAR